MVYAELQKFQTWNCTFVPEWAWYMCHSPHGKCEKLSLSVEIRISNNVFHVGRFWTSYTVFVTCKVGLHSYKDIMKLQYDQMQYLNHRCCSLFFDEDKMCHHILLLLKHCWTTCLQIKGSQFDTDNLTFFVYTFLYLYIMFYIFNYCKDTQAFIIRFCEWAQSWTTTTNIALFSIKKTLFDKSLSAKDSEGPSSRYWQ